ncbi:sensor histidine kinase [Rhodobacteraceae bacterium KMM 6894]|nr:sensor histidine kinase [Rhodobacteraceae bacterium KMM 6894]
MQSDPSDVAPKRPISRGLRFRIAAVLALALLPIGVMGILQTRYLTQEVASRTELTVLALSNRAAFGERQVIERAFGAAEALSAILQIIQGDPEACRRYLSGYLIENERYSFVGFVPPDGIVTCSSADTALDFSASQRIADWSANPRPSIAAIATPIVSRESVINILHPVFEDGAFTGYVSISMPVQLVLRESDETSDKRPLSLTTFNAEGGILSSQSSLTGDLMTLPANIPLAQLAGNPSVTFVAPDRTGRQRNYAVVPIIPGLAYALAVWPVERGMFTVAGFPLAPAIVPLLMFVASLGVSYLAVDRLVVRHVSGLRRRMQAFAKTRSFQHVNRKYTISSELEDLESAFSDMAFSLMDDEAQMEDALREKNVLLKEVHHRVKNNLQLISSIMNMQIRKARQPETVAVLKRLQERILGLATVHRNLYQAENLSQTNAGVLMSELFNHLVISGAEAGSNLDFRGDFDDVILFPDQAVPLALLASELATNALKYVGSTTGGRPRIRAGLTLVEPGIARMICENSVGELVEENGGTGLGSQLIRAFASQLDGDVQTETSETTYTVVVTFKVDEFSPEPADH